MAEGTIASIDGTAADVGVVAVGDELGLDDAALLPHAAIAPTHRSEMNNASHLFAVRIPNLLFKSTGQDMQPQEQSGEPLTPNQHSD
jgi:hypothetical protein